MNIELFTFSKSNRQGSPQTSLMTELLSRIKIRNFRISVTGLKGFDVSFKIVCTPEELYFTSITATSENCFITDPSDAKKQIDVIGFLRAHENKCEKIKEFLALLPVTPTQSTSSPNSAAQCSSDTGFNSTPQSRQKELLSRVDELQLALEQNQKELTELKAVMQDLPRFVSDEIKLELPRTATRFLESGEGLFSKVLPPVDVVAWIKKQLVPDHTSSFMSGGNTKIDEVNINVHIRTLILRDMQKNIAYHYTNVCFTQAANEPLSTNNLKYERLETKELLETIEVDAKTAFNLSN